jgi:hypothetical protein
MLSGNACTVRHVDVLVWRLLHAQARVHPAADYER